MDLRPQTDYLNNVVRFRARTVTRGDKQRPRIDYMEISSLMACMATLRLFVAVCIQLELSIYQGDMNTVYLNATLGIKQYLKMLEGYLCKTDGTIYVINKALDGLKQSGREWNSKVN